MKLRIPTLAVFVLALLAAASLAVALTLTDDGQVPANKSALDEHGRGITVTAGWTDTSPQPRRT